MVQPIPEPVEILDPHGIRLSRETGYAEGYRQAVCDLIPDPNARKDSSNGIFYAYLVGIIVGALIYKYTRE